MNIELSPILRLDTQYGHLEALNLCDGLWQLHLHCLENRNHTLEPLFARKTLRIGPQRLHFLSKLKTL